MAQDQDPTKNQGLGFPLHVRASKLLEDFLKGVENHFQYLQEILAEAKEHFVRRDSLELLPKTPCMKGKRKRIARSPQCSPVLASSPLQALPSTDDVCKTPDSKKPATCKVTIAEAIEPEVDVDYATSQDVSIKTSKRGREKKLQEGTKTKKSARGNRRKVQGRNTKKASEVNLANIIILEEDVNSTKAATPKRMTRSKRKEAEKDIEATNEIENIKKKNRVHHGAVNGEGANVNGNNTATPKQMTRSKRKESEKEMVVPSENLINESGYAQLFTPLPQPKKAKVNEASTENTCTPQHVEIFIPETPQLQKLTESTPTQNKDGKTVRSSIKVVLTPKSERRDGNEVDAYAEELDGAVSSNVVIVEARIYGNENNEVMTSTPHKDIEEKPISEPTVTSTKTLRRETRSSVKGTKRKQDSEISLQDKKPKTTPPILNSPNDPTQEDSINTQQNSAPEQESNSDSDNVVVSSTVTTPLKSQRQSFRPSRGGTRRSSRTSIQAKNHRKSKVRQSRSLVKSTVNLKLSAKKSMPSLEKSSEEEEFGNENVTKQLLFEESNVNTVNADSTPESTQEEASPEGVDEEDGKVATKSDELAVTTTTESSKPDSATDAHSLTSDSKEDDADVYHDAPGTSDEDEKYHSISETVDDAKGSDDNDDADDDADDDTGPITRSTSRNKISDSSSNSGRGSTSSRETEVLSPCKQSGDEFDRTQSSPEPSQENCVAADDGSSDDKMEEADDHDTYQNQFGFENKVLKNNTGVVDSFIRRNTPKKIDKQQRSCMIKLAIQEKEEKERERLERLAMEKQQRIEDQKRRREEKERKVAGIRAVKIREQREKKEQLDKKHQMRRKLEEKAKKIREKEEEAKKKARQDKKADCEARRKQEEEQRKQKRMEKEEEERRHREMMQRKAEFEEQERHRKILEAKRHQDHREAELQREKELEKLRIKKDIEEKERKAKEEREKQDKKLREEREKQDKLRDERDKQDKLRDERERLDKLREEREKLEKKLKEKEREERERKRIAALLKEKEEQDRKERERKAKEEKLRHDRELKFRFQQEAEKEKERLRKLQEQREIEEARLRALRDVNSYDMTPPPPPKAPSQATSENYNIDDICSDDSTDDEDCPRKKIPQWAQGAKLKAALINQSSMTMDEIEAIFGGVSMPNLDDIFTKKKRKRFYQRTSSAHWDAPPLKTVNRGTLI